MSEALVEIQENKPRRFRPYPEYKDSGVEWLGEIPKHWEVRRLKLLLTAPLRYGANESGEMSDENQPRYIRITDIRENGTLRSETFRSIPEEIAEPYLLEEGDILFARSGATVGKTFRYDRSWGRAAYAGYLIRARLDKMKADSRFLLYYTVSSGYWDWLRSNFIQATIQNVSAERYANLQIAVPHLREQRTIASFLDRETAKIDALVAKKERLIDLLQEKRTALITRAVTRGLDPNVPTKDSGVEWLGEVPEHWEVTPLSRILQRITYGFTNPMPVADEGPYMLTAFDIGDGEILYENARRTTEEAFAHLLTDKSRPTVGDVLLTKDGTLGRVAIASAQRMCINQSVALLRFDRTLVQIDFVHKALRAAPYQNRMIFEAGGTAIKHIYISRLARMLIALPPIDEQSEISRFISAQLERIGALQGKVGEAIDRLKEYRTALISAAVTGKIDVREELP